VSDVDAMTEVLVYDYDRAALALGVSASFLRKQVMAGRIMHNKLGRNVRFTRAHLDAYLAATEQPMVVRPRRVACRATTISAPRSTLVPLPVRAPHNLSVAVKAGLIPINVLHQRETGPPGLTVRGRGFRASALVSFSPHHRRQHARRTLGRQSRNCRRPWQRPRTPQGG